MKNLAMYRQAAGDRIDVVVMSGTDFGSQNGPFISPDAYREMFKPLHDDHERLGARAHEVEDLLPHLRVHRRLPGRLRRGGHRHPEPGPDFRRGHGPGDP